MTSTNSKRMNPERKAEWVAALRSKKYKQGRQRLVKRKRNPDTGETEWYYCCLGVACDLAVKAGIIGIEDVNDLGVSEQPDFVLTDSDDPGIVFHENATLPEPVQRWFGINTDNPLVRQREVYTSLTGFNDDYDLTFDEIADLIEEQL